MKSSGLKKMALAVCACVFAGSSLYAQSMGSTNSVQSSLSSASGYAIGHDRVGSEGLRSADRPSSGSLQAITLSGTEEIAGSFNVTRFGVRDGQLVAYGLLAPSSSIGLNAGSSGDDITGGVLMSSPLEPAGGYGSNPNLGAGSRIRLSGIDNVSSGASLSVRSAQSSGTSIGARSLNVIHEPFDASRLGSWTGIGTGYGESGVESRSSIVSDNDDEIVSMNLGRPYDDVSYMEDITWSSRLSGSSDLELSTDPSLESAYLLSRSSSSSVSPSSSVSVSVDAPLVSLGTSAGLYHGAEAERASAVSLGSELVAVPVSVVSASCDAVTLAFGNASTSSLGSETVTITSLSSSDDRLASTLCDLAEASISENRNAALLKHLNRLVSRTQ